MTNITINLDNNRFYPGNKISGQAICYFRSPKEFRKIRIRLHGHEHTQWIKHETYYDHATQHHRRMTVHYKDDNDVLLDDVIVHRGGNLPSGEYIFPIDFQLPNDIPSSYQCKFGQIKYTIQVTVDRPFKFDIEAFKEISILSLIRLQDMPSRMLSPVELSDEKTVCWFCCTGGNIEMRVTMKNKAFVVGQTENIKVYCLNMSNSNVEALHVKLIQTIIYKVTRPGRDYKYDSEIIATSLNDGVGVHGDKTYDIKLAVLPASPLPNFQGSDLFECKYELKVTACISGCHTNLDIKTDACVCHTPPPNVPYSQEDASSSVTDQPMPMPGEGYGFKVPLYPFPDASAPSAVKADIPSAPTKADVLDTTSGIGNSSKMEPPPPTYEQATMSYLPAK